MRREEVGRRRRHQLDAELLQVVVASQLHREVAGEPVRALYEDGTHAIAGDAGKHGLESSTLRHRVCTAHSRS